MSQVTDYILGVPSAVSNAIGVWARRTTNGDVQGVLIVDTDGSDVVTYSPLAKDGTDAVGTNAGTQSGSTTPGVGVRGWLSTLAGLFQNGIAKVMVREVANTAANVGQLSITNTATLVRSATSGRNVCSVRNIGGGTTDCYIGFTSGVTTSTGFLLRAASYDSVDIKFTGTIYAITISGSTTVAFYEEVQ